MSLIAEGSLVLFQGDSITDGERVRTQADDLGRGYARHIAAEFSALYPEQGVRFLNRGVDGDRVRDLRRRWQADCLDLHPTWVSILVGINDTWRRYDSGDATTVEAFEADYRAILAALLGPAPRLIICEPFVLPVPEDRLTWREDLDPKIAVVRRLAREFRAVLVPLDGVFAQAATRRDPGFWAPDGVHPSPAGEALMAQAWLRAVKAI